MAQGNVVAIFFAYEAGAPMQEVESAQAIAGQGLEGDRYTMGQGSFNRGRQGRRQVTLINARFLKDGALSLQESRRNIIYEGVDLMELLPTDERPGQCFTIGEAEFEAVKYCTPCGRPGKLAGAGADSQGALQDCGGIIARVVRSGTIKKRDRITTPHRGY